MADYFSLNILGRKSGFYFGDKLLEKNKSIDLLLTTGLAFGNKRLSFTLDMFTKNTFCKVGAVFQLGVRIGVFSLAIRSGYEYDISEGACRKSSTEDIIDFEPWKRSFRSLKVALGIALVV